MRNIIKTTAMLVIAILVVVLFALIAPDVQPGDSTNEIVSEYNTEYALQNLIKTYEVNEDTGIDLTDERKVDYCEN